MIKKIPISQLDKEHLSQNKSEGKEKRKSKVDFTKFVVNKPWGCEYLVYSNPYIEIWHLFIKKLAATSVHCHPNKKTGLILLEGEAIFSSLNTSTKLNPLDAIIMESGVFHSTQAISEGGVHILETETPPDKYDLLRLQDKYGRVRQGYEGKEALSPDRENCLRFFDCLADGSVEKEFYNKRIGVQEINPIRTPDYYQKIKESDLVIILDNRISPSSSNSFPLIDVIESSQFLDKIKNNQLQGQAEQELTIMFIKTILRDYGQ